MRAELNMGRVVDLRLEFLQGMEWTGQILQALVNQPIKQSLVVSQMKLIFRITPHIRNY